MFYFYKTKIIDNVNYYYNKNKHKNKKKMKLNMKFIHKNKESIRKFWLDLYKSSTLLDYVIMIISLVLCYRFISELHLDLTSFIILVIIAFSSSLLTTFVLDKFKYSKNRFVKLLQKFVIYNLLLLLTILFLVYFYTYLMP